MDIIEIARTVFRRWYVVVPVLMVTGVLVFAVASNAEPTYETSGSFLLADAALVGGSEQPGVTVTPQVVGEVVQGDAVRQRVREQGGTADYEVAVENAEGLMRITATGESEQAAVTTVQVVTEEIQRALAERQAEAGTPEQRRGTVEVLSSASTARLVVPDGAEDEAAGYVSTGALKVNLPDDTGGNPYAASLGGTTRVLEEVMQSPQVRQEITGERSADTYEVTMLPRDTAPILNLAVTSASAQGAMDTYDAVADRMATELRERQELAGARPASMLTLQPLSVPAGVTVAGGELRRPLIVIVGLGLVAAISLAVLVEGLATRARRERRRRGLTQPPLEPVSPDGPAGESQRVSQPVRGG